MAKKSGAMRVVKGGYFIPRGDPAPSGSMRPTYPSVQPRSENLQERSVGVREPSKG